jgi:hypothetical protein
VKKIREEKTKIKEYSNSRMTMLESSDFEDMWSFNHPHLSVKECQKKLHQMEVLVKK